MSTDEAEEAAAADRCCTNCGKAEVDDVKLTDYCEICDLAIYCGDECKQDHQETHETMCKQRAVELFDEILFTQPESSYRGDCPICFLPLPLDQTKCATQSCCGKEVCIGCAYANIVREEQQRIKRRCPFCRKPVPKTDEEIEKNIEKRAERNDPVALRELGMLHCDERDKAVDYHIRAAELGDASAHYHLSQLYLDEMEGGDQQDPQRFFRHCVQAAIAGHHAARFCLGFLDERQGRFERAVKHFIIGANLGHNNAIQRLKECYKRGHVSKDDFASALRAYQTAVEATKSPQRELAEKEWGGDQAAFYKG